MKRLDNFVSWSTAVVSGAFAAGGLVVREWLRAKGLGATGSSIAIAILFLILIKATEAIVRFCINNSSTIRRLILRDYYIEGSWIDINLNEGMRAIFAVSLVHFRFIDGQLTFGGEVFSIQGSAIGNFRSSTCRLDGHNFWYIYKRDVTLKERESVTGFGQLSFTDSAGPPDTYYGSFLDRMTNHQIDVQGRKILDKKTKLEMRTREGRKAVALREKQKFLEENSMYKEVCDDQSRMT